MQVTDFDPAEDILQISTSSYPGPFDSLEIVEADDGSYADVRVTLILSDTGSLDIAVIRRDGYNSRSYYDHVMRVFALL